ncbi:MAG: DUF5666 domain-containing protein [Acidobacteriota bacterium]
MTLQTLRSQLSGLWLAGLTSVVAASLVACGGGGSAASDNATAAPQTYTGTVSGLGSIVVNGVRFSTTGAEATDADDPRLPYTQAFKLGSTVVVNGSVDSDGANGQATSIQVEGGVRGQIAPGSFVFSAGSTVAGTLIVAGQVVSFDANTVFDGEGAPNFTAVGLAATDFSVNPIAVEVYGSVDASGALVATRIEKKDLTSLVYAVKGYVVNGTIDTTAKTFDMLIKRGLTLTDTVHVSYSGATVLPVGATLHDGVGVRVLSASDPAGQSSIAANKLLIKSDRGVNGSAAKLHGVVTAMTATTWTIGDVTIDVTKNPILRGFTSLTDVQVGTEVRVAGLFKDNVLTAKIVESDDYDHDRDGGGVKLFGVATGVDPNARTFSVQGVTVKVPLLLAMPTDGSYVEVVATQINGVLTALRIGSNTTRPFELFGTTACTGGVTDLQTTFALALPVNTVAVNGSAARIVVENLVDMSASTSPKTCLLEVKGSMTTVGSVKTLAATRIEVKRRF